MRAKLFFILVLLIIGGCLFSSCQKEIEGLNGVTPAKMKPKLGTTWTYRYYVYHQNGSVYTTSIVTHKAQSEETIGGEKWLKIVDVAADTVVYMLNEKTGGLYQYTNTNSYLLCKYPAALNDTYTTFNEGSSEDFKVKGVNDTLPTGIGDVPANYYEGFKGTQIIDLIWYNEYAWIVRKTQYRNRSLITPSFYKYYTFFLDVIVY